MMSRKKLKIFYRVCYFRFGRKYLIHTDFDGTQHCKTCTTFCVKLDYIYCIQSADLYDGAV